MANNIIVKKGNVNDDEKLTQLIESNPSQGDAYLITNTFVHTYSNPSIEITYSKAELVYWDSSLGYFKQFTLPISDLFTKKEVDQFNKNFQAWALHWFTELVNDLYVHLPIIRDDTWWTWSYELNEYVNTGHPTIGPQGPQGPQGEQGPQGVQGPPSVTESLIATYTFTQSAGSTVANRSLEFNKVSGDISISGSEIGLTSPKVTIEMEVSINFGVSNTNTKYQEVEFKFLKLDGTEIKSFKELIDSTLPFGRVNMNLMIESINGFKVVMNATEKLVSDTAFSINLFVLGVNQT